jgi:exodeoxyribonuclease-1
MLSYLLSLRNKNRVTEVVNLNQPQPFVFTSTRYGHNYNFTSVAVAIAEGTTNNAILTYNLRYDPTPWLQFDAAKLAELRFTSYEDLEVQGLPPFPFHTLVTNQCPAVAPVSVLNEQDGWNKLGLNPDTVNHNLAILKQNPQLIDEVKAAYQAEAHPVEDRDPETRLYDGFLNDADRQTVATIRNADEAKLATWSPYFHDERLPELFLHYKARNYPDTLSQPELQQWKDYRSAKIASQQPKFDAEMAALKPLATPDQQPLLDQLQEWRDQISSI